MMMGPEALGRLIDAHAAGLVLFARQWCASAEDVVQEAFVKLLRQRQVDSPVAWLFRAVRNGAIDAGRAERRRQRHEAVAAARSAAWFAPAGEGWLDGEAVRAALERVPPDQRECIVAYLWGGLTFEQIAELAGCSASTAHRRYLAGLASLRERLGVPCPSRTATPG